MCIIEITWQEFIDLVKALTPLAIFFFPIIIFKKHISELLSEFKRRLKTSNKINIVSKFASIEMERTRVAPTGVYKGTQSPGPDTLREEQRKKLYEDSRGMKLVHTLSKSSRSGQLFDIEIFIIPHKHSSMKGLSKVSYFFGAYWQNKTYETDNRFNGFLISTSAYGPFLCTAELHFNDGHTVTLSRYIDFEMGDFAPVSLIEHIDTKDKKDRK